jgi:porin
LSATEFYGDYRTLFMNAAFNFPMTLKQMPLSTFGGGVIGIPREDLLLSALALGASGTPDSNDPAKTFGGVLVLGSGTLTVKPFGLVGHRSLNVSWNDKESGSLSPKIRPILQLYYCKSGFPDLLIPDPFSRMFLGGSSPPCSFRLTPQYHKSSSTFDQYFWQPDNSPKHGIGLFFAFGASDGNPNPIQYSFLSRIGGRGVMPVRPDDSFGVGIARTQFSSAFVPVFETTIQPRPAARGRDRDVLQHFCHSVAERDGGPPGRQSRLKKSAQRGPAREC